MKYVRYKNIPFTEALFKRIEDEKTASGINANSIVIMAVDEYLKKKERERK